MSCSECKHMKTWKCRKNHECLVVDGVMHYLSQSGEECADFELEYYEEAPPLGIKPAWLFYETRMKELGEAISRYAEMNNPHNVRQIKRWSQELYAITVLYEYLRDYKSLR